MEGFGLAVMEVNRFAIDNDRLARWAAIGIDGLWFGCSLSTRKLTFSGRWFCLSISRFHNIVVQIAPQYVLLKRQDRLYFASNPINGNGSIVADLLQNGEIGCRPPKTKRAGLVSQAGASNKIKPASVRVEPQRQTIKAADLVVVAAGAHEGIRRILVFEIFYAQ